jgi:hypothetical protein
LLYADGSDHRPKAIIFNAAQDSKDDGSIPIVFHVTSVIQDVPPDWCATGECFAVEFTVKGYTRIQSDTYYTQYILKCTEVTAFDATPHVTLQCARVRANANYDAKLFADYIFFIDHNSKHLEFVDNSLQAFNIVSQIEIATPR